MKGSHRILFFIWLILSVTLIGCGAKMKIADSNPRLIVTNLLPEIKELVPEPEATPVAVLPAAFTPEPSPVLYRYFIEFPNEQATTSLDAVAITMDYVGDEDDTIVVLLGQSHGPSAVGNGKLARQRVDFVYRRYIKHGFPKDHLYRMSGWASERPDYTCGRGVEVVFLRRSQKGFSLPMACSEYDYEA